MRARAGRQKMAFFEILPVRPPIGSRQLSPLITTSSLKAINHSPRWLSRGVVPPKNERSQGEQNRRITGRPAMGTEAGFQTNSARGPVCCPGSRAVGVRSSPGGGLSPSFPLVQVPQAPFAFNRESVEGTSILTRDRVGLEGLEPSRSSPICLLQRTLSHGLVGRYVYRFQHSPALSITALYLSPGDL